LKEYGRNHLKREFTEMEGVEKSSLSDLADDIEVFEVNNDIVG